MGLCWVCGSWGLWLSSHGMQGSHWGPGGQQGSGELEGRRAEAGQPGARWLRLRGHSPWAKDHGEQRGPLELPGARRMWSPGRVSL